MMIDRIALDRQSPSEGTVTIQLTDAQGRPAEFTYTGQITTTLTGNGGTYCRVEVICSAARKRDTVESNTPTGKFSS